MNETVENYEIKQSSFFKRSARKLLYSQWFLQIFAFIIVMSCVVGIDRFGVALGSVMFSLFESVYAAGIVRCVYLVFSLAVLIPLLYGLVCFEIRAVENNADLANLFCAFADMDILNRAYTLFFYVLYKSIVYFLPSIVLGLFIELVYFSGIFGFKASLFGVDVVRLLLTVLLVVALYLGFVMSSRNVVGIYVSIVRCDISLRECFFIASACVHMARRCPVKLAVSFVPLCILSLFTVGFLFIAYTLPYMLITFVLFSKHLYDAEMATRATSRLMYKGEDLNNNEY